MCVWTETIVRLKLEVWQQCSRWTRTTEGRDERANRCRGRTTEQTFTFCLARWLREPTVRVYQQQQHNDICRLLIDHRPTRYAPFNFCFSTLSNSEPVRKTRRPCWGEAALTEKAWPLLVALCIKPFEFTFDFHMKPRDEVLQFISLKVVSDS